MLMSSLSTIAFVTSLRSISFELQLTAFVCPITDTFTIITGLGIFSRIEHKICTKTSFLHSLALTSFEQLISSLPSSNNNFIIRIFLLNQILHHTIGIYNLILLSTYAPLLL